MVNERFTGRLIAASPVGVTAAGLQSLPRCVRASSRVRRASSLLALGAILPPHAVEAARFQGPLGGALVALILGNAEAYALLVGPALALGGLLLFAVAAQVDDASHHASGPIIFLGSTILSNSSAETYAPPTAACRKVVPFLCA